MRDQEDDGLGPSGGWLEAGSCDDQFLLAKSAEKVAVHHTILTSSPPSTSFRRQSRLCVNSDLSATSIGASPICTKRAPSTFGRNPERTVKDQLRYSVLGQESSFIRICSDVKR